MEARALLSAGPGGGPDISAMVRRAGAPIRLHGTLDGSYQIHATIPDVGATYQLSGSGHIVGFGPASVSGTVHGLGFIARGRVRDNLTLEDPGDASITLRLTATAQQPGFSALPPHYTYRVTGGTGKDQGARGSGLATLTLTPGPSGESGSFTLAVTPGTRAHHA